MHAIHCSFTSCHAALLISASLLLASCSSLNRHAGLRSDNDLPTLAAVQAAASDQTLCTLVGHDRQHWEETTLILPTLTTEVHPTYGSSDSILRSNSRQKGLYPVTTGDMPDVLRSTFDPVADACEIVIAPVLFLAEAAFAPFQMLFRWPLNVENSPANSYERLGSSDAPYAGWMVSPVSSGGE